MFILLFEKLGTIIFTFNNPLDGWFETQVFPNTKTFRINFFIKLGFSKEKLKGWYFFKRKNIEFYDPNKIKFYPHAYNKILNSTRINKILDKSTALFQKRMLNEMSSAGDLEKVKLLESIENNWENIFFWEVYSDPLIEFSKLSKADREKVLPKKDGSNEFNFKTCENKYVLITKEMCDVFIEIYNNHKELLFQKRIYEYYKHSGWLFSRCKLYKKFKKKREYIENTYEVAKELKGILADSDSTDTQEKIRPYQDKEVTIEENQNQIIIRCEKAKYIWDVVKLEDNYQSEFLRIPSKKAILNIKKSYKDKQFILHQMIILIERDILTYNYKIDCRKLLLDRINVDSRDDLSKVKGEQYTELCTFLNIMMKNDYTDIEKIIKDYKVSRKDDNEKLDDIVEKEINKDIETNFIFWNEYKKR